jgi:tRNA threonylcarbamoyladenosine biosynthesis protein TsaB
MPSPHPLPVLLAFDTSTETLAVALCAAGRVHARQAPGGAQASARLLPLVHELLAEAALPLSSVQAVAFGRGPGAFTGLRTSCAVAQGLALGLGCPVLPLDSLLIVAEDARWQLDPQGRVPWLEVGVAMDARMDEIYAGRWRWQAGGWRPLQPPVLTTPEALAAEWTGDGSAGGAPRCAGDAATPAATGAGRWIVAGSALTAFGARLPWPVGVHPVPVEQDRAAALARLALVAWQAGAGVDAAQALPLYLRDKVALTTAERDAARAAAATGSAVPVPSAPRPAPAMDASR